MHILACRMMMREAETRFLTIQAEEETDEHD